MGKSLIFFKSDTDANESRHYWVQANIDQLSYTFGRKITGIHNRTYVKTFTCTEYSANRS
jgi:predicted DNA-binding WGR domain protein